MKRTYKKIWCSICQLSLDWVILSVCQYTLLLLLSLGDSCCGSLYNYYIHFYFHYQEQGYYVCSEMKSLNLVWCVCMYVWFIKLEKGGNPVRVFFLVLVPGPITYRALHPKKNLKVEGFSRLSLLKFFGRFLAAAEILNLSLSPQEKKK